MSCFWNSPLLPSTLKSKARQIFLCVILTLKANAVKLFPFHGCGFPFPGPHRGCPRRIQSGLAVPAFVFKTKQKINKETQTLYDTMDQLDLIDIHRIFHPKIMNFTFYFKCTWKILQDNQNWGHKSSLGKLKKKK